MFRCDHHHQGAYYVSYLMMVISLKHVGAILILM